MKIIALYGKGDAGKSTTLLMLIAKLMKKHADTCILPPSRSLTAKAVEQELERRVKATNRKDKYVQDEVVKFEINGHVVGITTQGDNDGCLKNAFKQFTDCDIVICATRSSGSSVDYVQRIVGKENVIWYRQCDFSCDTYSHEQRIQRYLAIADSISNLLLQELNLLVY